jgi:hypothetical protein
MARTLRGRICGHDNLAVGQVSGTERTINGSAPPAEKVGGKDNFSPGNAFPTAVIPDNHVAGTATPTEENP